MKKFMLLFISSAPAEELMKVTAEQMNKSMQVWIDWFGKVGSAMVDKGGPLGNAAQINGGHRTGVSGYCVMQAESMDALKAMLTDHPHLMAPGARIEVLEMLPMTPMPM